MSWLLGLKGATRGGLNKLADMLMLEREATKQPMTIVQAAKQPSVWTGMDGAPRTALPRTDTALKIVPGPGRKYRIPDLVDVPPEILKAYPELVDISVISKPSLPGQASGLSHPNENLIELAQLSGIFPVDQRRLLQHEITHLVPQRSEGFSAGASNNAVQKQITDYVAKLRTGEPLAENAVYRSQNNKTWPLPTDPEEFEKLKYMVYKQHAGESEARLMEDSGRTLDDIINQITNPRYFKNQTPYKKGGLVQMKDHAKK